MPQRDDIKVAVIGAGPVGLAAAAHLLERGLTPIVLEAGPAVGNSVRQWSHVRLFSPWQYNIDKASKRLLDSEGWNSPDPDYYPTGAELIETISTRWRPDRASRARPDIEPRDGH